MFEDDRAYIILRVSQANKTSSPSISPTYISLRQKFIENGTLIDKGEYYEFTADTIFGSISPAANVVSGRQSNGNIEWINDQERPIKNDKMRFSNQSNTTPSIGGCCTTRHQPCLYCSKALRIASLIYNLIFEPSIQLSKLSDWTSETNF
jgi:hypothetical protein